MQKYAKIMKGHTNMNKKCTEYCTKIHINCIYTCKTMQKYAKIKKGYTNMGEKCTK